MPEQVPPIPFKSPIANSNGFLNDSWAKWFRQIFARVGGNVALSNTELAEQRASDLSTLNSDISSLQTITSAHDSTLTDVPSLAQAILDLEQGPNL